MDAPVQVFSCKESSFVPLVLSVRYATDGKHQETTPESGCILCETGALYQSFGHLPTISQKIDTINVFVFCDIFLPEKPVNTGIFGLFLF